MAFFLTDDQGNEEVIKGSILPRDVMNYKQGVRFCVAFNNYNQPIRKGGYIFVRFLGYIARLERFCPIGMISCLLYTSPSPRDGLLSRMPSSA